MRELIAAMYALLATAFSISLVLVLIMHTRRAGHLVARPLNSRVTRLMRELMVAMIALLAAALSSSLVLALVSDATSSVTPLLLMFLLLGYSLVPAFAFGFLFAVLRFFHMVRWWSAVLGGVAIGMLLATGLPGTNPWVLEVCLLMGVVTGSVFWAVWRTGMRHKGLGVRAPIQTMCQAPNKQLQRTVTWRRGDGASAPFHYALPPRFTRQRAAAELRR
jgi:hypothetical protein